MTARAQRRADIDAQHAQLGILVVGVVEEARVLRSERRRDISADGQHAAGEHNRLRRRRLRARLAAGAEDEQARDPRSRASWRVMMSCRSIIAPERTTTGGRGSERSYRDSVHVIIIVPGRRRVSVASGYGESSVTDSNRSPRSIQPRATRTRFPAYRRASAARLYGPPRRTPRAARAARSARTAGRPAPARPRGPGGRPSCRPRSGRGPGCSGVKSAVSAGSQAERGRQQVGYH